MRNVFLLFFTMLFFSLIGQVRIEEDYNPGLSRANGYITAVASGSAEAFRMELWKDGAIVYNTPGSFISGAYNFGDLGAGTYTIKVYDRNDCETILGPIVLIEEHNCDLDVGVVEFKHSTGKFDGACPSHDPYEDEIFEDGVIEVFVNTRDPYTLGWSGPDGFTATTERIENLRGGTYNLTVVNDVDGSCVLMTTYEVYYCSIRFADCYNNFDLHSGNSFEIELINKVSPTFGLNNGSLEVADNGLSLRYEFYWTDDQGNRYGTAAISGLGPGTYTFHVLSGCGPEMTEDFILYDCTIDPIVLEPRYECPDSRYTDFPITVSGGSRPQLFGPFELEGQTMYSVRDARGCVEEITLTHAEIGTWDVEITLLRPKSPTSFAQFSVRLIDADPSLAPYKLELFGNIYELSDLTGENVFSGNARDGINYITVFNNLNCEITKEVDFGSCSTLQELSVHVQETLF